MRSFLLPDRFINASSMQQNTGTKKHKKPQARYINIFMAIICDDGAWLLSDFARLARIHVISRSAPFSMADLVPGTPVSGIVFLLSSLTPCSNLYNLYVRRGQASLKFHYFQH